MLFSFRDYFFSFRDYFYSAIKYFNLRVTALSLSIVGHVYMSVHVSLSVADVQS